jgi:DNA-binding beta-propeller fold protein YncE
MSAMKMLSIISAILLLPADASLQQQGTAPARGREKAADKSAVRGGEDEFGPYQPIAGWPQPLAGQLKGSEGFTWGSTAGVFAETANKIFIAQRGEIALPPTLKPGMPVWAAGLRASSQKFRSANFILTVDANGKLIDNWTWNDHLITHPHSVFISPYDPEKHVWVIDDGGSQILKFTNDGKKLVMKLGEKDKDGDDERHFAGPTGIVFLPDGSFFVSDGYRNSRVVKFDRNGKFLLAFGKKGVGSGSNDPGRVGCGGPAQHCGDLETRPYYMNTVHSVAIGADGRLYVSDRSNSRIQIFDLNGKYLDEWRNIKSPYFLYATQDRHLWVADGVFQKIVEYDLNGKFVYSWGTQGGGNGKGIPDIGGMPGVLFGVHCVSVDQDGNFYTAEVSGGRAQKFTPRKGVESTRIVGQPVKLK